MDPPPRRLHSVLFQRRSYRAIFHFGNGLWSCKRARQVGSAGRRKRQLQRCNFTTVYKGTQAEGGRCTKTTLGRCLDPYKLHGCCVGPSLGAMCLRHMVLMISSSSEMGRKMPSGFNTGKWALGKSLEITPEMTELPQQTATTSLPSPAPIPPDSFACQ